MIFRFLMPLLMLVLMSAPVASAQPGLGAKGPAAAELNRTFAFADKWAMYGAPQETRLDEESFNKLAARVGQTRFAAGQVQIVVILRGADASGTIGLIEKRGRRVQSIYVKSGERDVYDIWRQIGFRAAPERISAAFRENALAAEEAYRDLPITFSGTVRGVGKDERGQVYVEFAVKGRSAGLICRPWEGAPQGLELRELKTGDKIRASAQFAGYGEDGTLMAKGCLFGRR